MEGIRSLVKIGMTTPVEIFRPNLDADADPSNVFGSDQKTYTSIGTILGWVFELTNPSYIGIGVGVQSYMMYYRMFVPVGTEIDSGYRVVIASTRYIVEDAAEDDTWQPMKRCTLRRLE